MKVVACIITVILVLVVAAFFFVGLLVVLNGYSEAKALPILIGYAIAAGLATLTASWLAGRGVDSITQRSRFPAWLAMVTSSALSAIGAAIVLIIVSFILVAIFPAN